MAGRYPEEIPSVLTAWVAVAVLLLVAGASRAFVASVEAASPTPAVATTARSVPAAPSRRSRLEQQYSFVSATFVSDINSPEGFVLAVGRICYRAMSGPSRRANLCRADGWPKRGR